MAMKKAMKAAMKSWAVDDSSVDSPDHETQLRGLQIDGVNPSGWRRPQTSATDEREEDPGKGRIDDADAHKKIEEAPEDLGLMRGGGGKKKNKKAPTAAAAPPQPAQPKKPEPAAAAAATTLEEAVLVQDHWNVPVVSAVDMKADGHGVCIASKKTFEAKKDILQGRPGQRAMLVPIDTVVGDGSTAQVLCVSVVHNEVPKQVTRKLVQLGTEPVRYIKPATKGEALKIQAMKTMVLEINRFVCGEDKWKATAVRSEAILRRFTEELLKGTKWTDVRPSRVRTRMKNDKVTALQSFVRIPADYEDAFLKASGMKGDPVFVRSYVDRRVDGDTKDGEHKKLATLWLNDVPLDEARKKVQALPENEAFGLAANERGIAARVLEGSAANLATVLGTKQFSRGDKYTVQGVPRDCTWEELANGFANADDPWLEIQSGRKVFQRGGTWTVQAPQPPPVEIYFLGELCLIVTKVVELAARARVERPKPRASDWQTVPDCPPPRATQAWPSSAKRNAGDDEMPDVAPAPKAPRVEEVQCGALQVRQQQAQAPAHEGAAASASTAASENSAAQEIDRKFEIIETELIQVKADFASLNVLMKKTMEQQAALQQQLTQLMASLGGASASS